MLLISLTIGIIVFLLLVLIVMFTLFKSSTPRSFSELLFEIKFIYQGVKSNVADATIGMCYNQVCEFNFFCPLMTVKSIVYLTHTALFRQTSSVAVLTGGNRGLGLQILKKLLECEMTVILGTSGVYFCQIASMSKQFTRRKLTLPIISV
jgi:hypothetical protein